MLVTHKNIFITFILIKLAIQSQAQQSQNFSQYMFNGFLTNPATVGSKDKISTGLFYRTQWIGMKQAPAIQSFNIQAPFNYNRMGLGLQVINQTAFSERITSASLAYSYKINLGKGKMSFGLEAGLIQGLVNLNGLIVKEQEDVVTQANSTIYLPNLCAGLFYQTKTFNIGISAKHLLSNPNKKSLNIPLTQRQYFLFSSVKLNISKDFQIIPSALIKYVNNIPLQADLTTHFKFQEKVWIGGSYRTQDAISIQAGFRLDQLIKGIRQEIRIGYAYDYPLTAINYISKSSHEIMLVMDFEIDKSPKQIRKSKIMISPIFF